MKNWLTYILILCSFAVQAQNDSVSSAYNSLVAGDLERARVAIEAASQHPETSGDAQTWYFRGFIYKEIYNLKERSQPDSPAREVAFSSFLQSIHLDTTGEDLEENRKNIRYLAATYFNDAKEAMNPEEYDVAIRCYRSYRDAMIAHNPNIDLTDRDIEFNNALGSVYNRIYDSNPEQNEQFFSKIQEVYNKVLELDSNNISANYNLGILFYNKAVNIINNLDYDMDMFAFMEVQENCVEIFKQSLPFMEKAYELDPNRKETLIGLSGIYFSLHEIDKSEELKKKIAELDNK